MMCTVGPYVAQSLIIFKYIHVFRCTEGSANAYPIPHISKGNSILWIGMGMRDYRPGFGVGSVRNPVCDIPLLSAVLTRRFSRKELNKSELTFTCGSFRNGVLKLNFFTSFFTDEKPELDFDLAWIAWSSSA